MTLDPSMPPLAGGCSSKQMSSVSSAACLGLQALMIPTGPIMCAASTNPGQGVIEPINFG